MTSFATDIAPLFRPGDVRAMRSWFDLSDHAEVSANAEGVLDRIEDGSMPCDTTWPDEHVALLRAWIDEGCPA